MVLKKCPPGFNSGGTIRQRLVRGAQRAVGKKSINITNGKTVPARLDHYRKEHQQYEELSRQIERKADECCIEDVWYWQDLYQINQLVDYFISLDHFLTLNQFSYIPDIGLNKIGEILEHITALKMYQRDINHGIINTGHSEAHAIRITVTHNIDTVYWSESIEHVFKSVPDAEFKEELRTKGSKAHWDKTWHNEHFRGVQRETELRRVKQRQYKDDAHCRIGWQEEFVEHEFTNFEDIHIIITEPREPNRIKLHSHIDIMPSKLNKKGKGEKVKRSPFWNNINPAEIHDAIESRVRAGMSYLTPAQWPLDGIPEQFRIHIPVGLPPAEAEAYRRKMEKRRRREINERNRLRSAEMMKKEKEKSNEAKLNQQDAFITSVPDPDASTRKKREPLTIPPANEKKTVKIEKRVEKEKVQKRHLWEFIEDLVQGDSNKKSHIIFKKCSKHQDSHANNADKTKQNFEKTNITTGAVQGNKPSQSVQWENDRKDSGKKSENGRKRKKEKPKQKLSAQTGAVISKNRSNDVKTGGGNEEKSDKMKSVGDKSPTKSILKEVTYTDSVQASPKLPDIKSQHVQNKLKSFSDVSLSPIRLVVKTSTMRPSQLNRSFGSSYQEGGVYPRMFTLDISDKVKETLRMFRKVDEPFVEPIFVLLIEATHSNVDEMKSDNKLALTHIKLHLKADMRKKHLEQLYERMKEKVNIQLIYPLSKVVEYCVQMFKTLPYQGYLGAELISAPSLAADERTRSQLDWLMTLCQWKYQVYAASEAYLIFSNAAQNLGMPRPTTSGIGRIIEEAQNQLPAECAKRHCRRAPVIRLLPCQHAYCKQCLNSDVTKAISRQQHPLLCQVIGCKTALDPVSLAFALSLPQQKMYSIQEQTRRIAAHPLWQWCPNPTCGRVVKLGGAGVLDSIVVIMCECGTSWCFHCQREGHWPAPCPQATTYLDDMARDSTTASSHVCDVVEVTCSSCVATASGGGVREGSGETDDSGVEADDACRCRYEMCRLCVDSQNSPLAIPRSLVNNKGLSKEACRSVLISLLYYRSALLHRTERLLWNWSTVEIRTSTVLHKLRRSARLRILPSPSDAEPVSRDNRSAMAVAGGSLQPTPPLRLSAGVREMSHAQMPKTSSFFNRPTTSQPVITPKQEAEKFFLVTVQQFVHQCHVLLEYVYVYMMDGMLLRKTPEVTKLAVKLEAIIERITQMVTSSPNSGVKILEELHRLHETGNQTMKALTSLLQSSTTAPSVVFRTPTFFKTGFAKLPPIGQKTITPHSDYV